MAFELHRDSPHAKRDLRSTFLNRRDFLKSTAASIALGALPNGQGGAPESADRLNPQGIEVAGIRMVPVVSGKYKVWTKRIGSGAIKVLVLHGGPGFSHEYLEALESFLPPAGIEIYYYDQLGCNNSDRPNDSSLWTLPRYVDEVEEVRRGLGLEKFVLYGHSWGGILGIDYALKYQHHLRALVISNMAAGIEAYQKRIAWWKGQLPSTVRVQLDRLEAKEDYDSPEYQKIMMETVYPLMLCRTNPWPEPLTRAFRHVNEKLYVQMQGKSEFLVTGNLRGWERWNRLHEIEVKALTIGAKYDEMDPEDLKRMAKLMPQGTSAYCASGSHLSLWDDQQSYFRQLLGFLRTL
jgi:proline iminopeptidase